MSRSAPATSEIPRWPKTAADLNSDGSGRLTIDGRTEDLEAGDITQSRALVIERVAQAATKVGRPVRLTSIDPDGEWELAVHPDGHVDELGARPSPTRGGGRAGRDAASTPTAPIASVPRGTVTRTRRQKRAGARLLAAVAVLALVGSAIAVIFTTTGNHKATKSAASTIAPPRKVPAAPNASTRAQQTASKQLAARKRHARTVKKHAAVKKRRAAAHKRTVLRKRAARRHAARRRAARRRPAASRPPARAARPAAPPTVQAPPPRPAAPRPPPAASHCGEFDVC